MTTTCSLAPVLAPLAACAPRANDPADVQAIKQLMSDCLKAISAGGAAAVVAAMTDKTAWLEPHTAPLVGRDASAGPACRESARRKWGPSGGLAPTSAGHVHPAHGAAGPPASGRILQPYRLATANALPAPWRLSPGLAIWRAARPALPVIAPPP